MLVKTESINKRALSFYRRKGFVEQEQVVEKLNGIEVNLAVLKLDLRKTYVK
jgi:ribosomal protein S18 acetylase RimI-like enzyme